jgi:hypothetical protein
MRTFLLFLAFAVCAAAQSNDPLGRDPFGKTPERIPNVDAPEPGSAILMLSAGAVAAGFGLMRRRKG